MLRSFSGRSVGAAVIAALAAACGGSRDAAPTAPTDRAPSFQTAAPANLASVAANIRINEVESQNGTPGDWVEFINTGAEPLDISGYFFKDNDNSRTWQLPAGSIVPAGGFLVIDEATGGNPGGFPFGLGSPDEARLFAPDNATLIDGYGWPAHAATTYGRCPDGTGAFVTTGVETKGTANDCAPVVRLNEFTATGANSDWIEIFNPGAEPLPVGGHIIRQGAGATGGYVIPAGTTIAAGAYLVIDESALGFAIPASGRLRLFRPNGTTVLDDFTYAATGTSWGRCPNGTGAFTQTAAATRGAANNCAPPPSFGAWPGSAQVSNGETGNAYGGNMSGLIFENRADTRAGILWAVKNGPGALYRITAAGGPLWLPAGPEWTNGKLLRYTDGTGDVDAEGVTLVGNRIYVGAERNNGVNSVSRNSVLLYDPSQPGPLTALREWNLTADLPATGPNLGIEAIAFIPDAFLVANGFIDQSTGQPYTPASYPNNNGGIFFVGLEANGTIYGYALDHVTGGFTRVATFASGFPGVMELTFESEQGWLLAICDDTCQGRSAGFRIAGGAFQLQARWERPTGMPNLNNEGFAFAAQRLCVNGTKPAWWLDDSNTGGIAIRTGSISCALQPNVPLSGFLAFGRSE